MAVTTHASVKMNQRGNMSAKKSNYNYLIFPYFIYFLFCCFYYYHHHHHHHHHHVTSVTSMFDIVFKIST